MNTLLDILKPCKECENWAGNKSHNWAICFHDEIRDRKGQMIKKHKDDTCPHWEQEKGLDLPDVFKPGP